MPGTEKESDKSSSGSLTWIQWVQLLVVSSGVFLSALDVSVNVPCQGCLNIFILLRAPLT